MENNFEDSKEVVVGAAIGGATAVVAVPVVVGALGFSSGGIVAGSVAASLMSASAIASGGGVAAGSAVAVMQTIGVVGLGAVALPVLGIGATLGALGVLGWKISKIFK